MLCDLDLLPVYDSSNYDLISDLQVPLLKNSTSYLRGVGYFTSGWLRLVVNGLKEFVEKGGKIRLIISPFIENNDWDAILLGVQAMSDSVLKALLDANVTDFVKSVDEDTLIAFSWMIADEIIELRIAVPKDSEVRRNYHDKVGIFRDETGNEVALHGSLNDSIQGSFNGEAFSVFCSWVDSQKEYFESHKKRLDMLWSGENSHFNALLLPEAIKNRIVSLKKDNQRPYKLPSHTIVCSPLENKNIKLRPYQLDAIDSWLTSNCRGIFEMATGSGKTITSLSAAMAKIQILGKGIIIILVPYIHLLDQWESDCSKFGLCPILCGSDRKGWQAEVREAIRNFKIGLIEKVCIIAVHKTASGDKFKSAIDKISSDFTIMIVDEVHGLGAPDLRKGLLPNINMRLGLSATPERWLDKEGSEVIKNYFEGSCYVYSLENAIKDGYLVHYLYNPVIVNLDEDETMEYIKLTKQIVQMYNATKNDITNLDALKKLKIRRAAIVGNASQKKIRLLENIQEQLESKNSLNEFRDVLIYCAPGSHKEILKRVASLGVKCHEFVGEVSSKKRQDILQRFAHGDLHALVAIKCLDEGVDAPSTRTAHIMASSQNPRQFIQRRGRILRNLPGKVRADIYDYVVMPSLSTMDDNGFMESLIRREMPRFAEFASLADNQYQAKQKIWNILDSYGLLHLLDQKPWEISNEYTEEGWLADEDESG